MRKMNNSFYVTLPSNVQGAIDNRISDYTTILPNTLRLSDDYHVAITEISYTKSWYNVTQQSTFKFYDYKGEIAKIAGIGVGYYSLIDLVNTINTVIKDCKKIIEHPVLELDNFRKSVKIRNGKTSIGPVSVFLGYELEEMLGFARNDSYNIDMLVEKVSIHSLLLTDSEIEKGYREPSQSVDIKAGIHFLMVYSDIVSHSIVGNTYANFLRSVKIDETVSHGDDVNIVFQKPYYFPIALHDINQIRINIKDDGGRPFEFQFGRVSVTLHFKKVWKAII